jgi:hypothetical protein
MGARVCAESLQHQKITLKEARLLLAFCNNIGPVYVTGYVLTLFPARSATAMLLGMYGIPLLYGLLLRYTKYRNISNDPNIIQENIYVQRIRTEKHIYFSTDPF